LDEQLAELDGLLATMCTSASEALRDATVALVDGRERLAQRVIAGESAVQALRDRVEETASLALLFHAPVAGDLRSVVAAIHSSADVERMERLAVHVAQASCNGRPRLPEEVRPAFREMGTAAVELGLKVARVVRSRNVVLALDLPADDDLLDDLHRRMFTVLMHPDWTHGIATAVGVTLLARYYERFADRAVKVARSTVFAVTGEKPEALLR
jgi:phosphate transport system protein